MKKTLNKIVFILLVSMAIIGCSKDDATPEIITEEETGEVTGGETKSSAKELLSFVFATADNQNLSSSVTATINEGAKTITAVLPYGTDLTGLTPTIEVAAAATISPTGEQDFSSAVTYTVTAEDASTVDYTMTITIADQLPFVTTWQTTTAKESITIYINSSAYDEGDYDFTIDWGDGSDVETGLSYDSSHEYAEAGIYTVSISGKFPAIRQDDIDNAAKLLTIESWGDIAWRNMESAFYYCTSMTYNATDVPNLSNVINMSRMFSSAFDFNGDLSSWDVSSVTDMSRMFSSAFNFNGDISSWEVGAVTDISFMFDGARDFNQDIPNWDVSNVTDMSYMFSGTEFNGNISSWTVNNVENMSYMFSNAVAFNQNISGWDVSKVTNMSGMFDTARTFNQDISGWTVSSVTNMSSMFSQASDFNVDISSWDVSNVENMSSMFLIAYVFNQNLSGWATGNVTSCTNFSNYSGLDDANLPTAGCFSPE